MLIGKGTGGTLAPERALGSARPRTRPTARAASSPLLQADPDGPEWALVLRIAASPRFQRSALLTDFLFYICRQALTGDAARISEHHIGVQVFGRDEHFNRSDDNIVRNYARMLRTRLDDYFREEGTDESLRLLIPRGGYVPVFAPAEQIDAPVTVDIPEKEQAAISDPEPLPAAEPAWRRPLRSPAWLITIGLLAGFALAVAQPWNWLLQMVHPAERLNQVFWQSFFSRGHEAMLVTSDDGLVMLHRFIEKPTTLRDYVSGSYRSTENIAAGLNELLPNSKQPDLAVLTHKIETIGNAHVTTIVDLNLAERIARFSRVNPDQLTIRYARDLHIDDLKNNNVVLIGSVNANPWVSVFQPELNFQFMPGGKFGGSEAIINRTPLPGEAKTYASITGDPALRTYGVLAYLPNLSGTGHVLIIEGINMAGTQAAGEFLLNADQMSGVIRRARRPNGEIRPFEILLETASVGASSSELRILSERISPL